MTFNVCKHCCIPSFGTTEINIILCGHVESANNLTTQIIHIFTHPTCTLL